VLGIASVFSAGYGNVGSSIYYASHCGLVALGGLAAGPGCRRLLFHLYTRLTYAEGNRRTPEAGGSASFARHALVTAPDSWLAGADAQLHRHHFHLAYTIPPYLGFFWEPFKDSAIIGTFASIGIVGFLMAVNVVGIKETIYTERWGNPP
jgi:APA family basic amino acid/polyamine antiporter